jgi:Rrf2 family nitric oxide-sensitive transcriptional repressor
MRLNAFTDYSLRVLIFLAAEPGRRATIAEVARTFAISENHLTKVVHFLGKQGWLTNVRGKGGGMELGQAATQIGIGQVVRATEGADLPAECFGDHPGSCTIAASCQLKKVLQEAVEAFHLVLDAYTLADLVQNSAELARMLDIQPIQLSAPLKRGLARRRGQDSGHPADAAPDTEKHSTPVPDPGPA